MSFRRGVMRGPKRIFCTDCFRDGILARRVYSPVNDWFRCPRCLRCLPRVLVTWGRR